MNTIKHYLSYFKWYRKWKKGIWYYHESTHLLRCFYGSFWANYSEMNSFTKVTKIKTYD
jgi:hypothetical protein